MMERKIKIQKEMNMVLEIMPTITKIGIDKEKTKMTMVMGATKRVTLMLSKIGDNRITCILYPNLVTEKMTSCGMMSEMLNNKQNNNQ